MVCLKSVKILKKIINYVYDINIEDSYGFTPIMDCAKYGYFTVFKYLLSLDVNLYDINSYNQNIFHCVLYNKDYRLLEYLCNYFVTNNLEFNFD